MCVAAMECGSPETRPHKSRTHAVLQGKPAAPAAHQQPGSPDHSWPLHDEESHQSYLDQSKAIKNVADNHPNINFRLHKY